MATNPTNAGGTSEGPLGTGGVRSPKQINPDVTDGADDAPAYLPNAKPSVPGMQGAVQPGSVTVMAGCPVCGYSVSVDGYDGHVRAHGNMEGHPGAQVYIQISPDDPSKPF